MPKRESVRPEHRLGVEIPWRIRHAVTGTSSERAEDGCRRRRGETYLDDRQRVRVTRTDLESHRLLHTILSYHPSRALRNPGRDRVSSVPVGSTQSPLIVRGACRKVQLSLGVWETPSIRSNCYLDNNFSLSGRLLDYYSFQNDTESRFCSPHLAAQARFSSRFRRERLCVRVGAHQSNKMDDGWFCDIASEPCTVAVL